MQTVNEILDSSFEPKTSNRFIVEFQSPFNIPLYSIHKISLPSFTKAHQFSRIIWDDIIVEFYDPVSPSTSQAIMEGLRKLREMDTQDITISIKMLGPVGDTVSEWLIKGEIDTINFGELNWKKDDVVNITMKIKTTSAILNY